ncbi:MFS transporter [Rhodococcus sp. CH91]|uniref:MFS transporter n=1 Tax=Rhodococcus sp. CH91 TaxID=2910256 RepID=UPI001F4B6CA4|nr:MFS transporter [Rhodococcus sp. CH91]
MTQSTKLRRRGLCALFLLPGLALSSWVTRTPAIRDTLEASTGQMGLILLGLSIGSMAGIVFSGSLVERFGTRAVIGIGALGVVASMPTIGVAAILGQELIVGVGLGLFGLGMGSCEVALNIEGAAVEQATGQPLLPVLHGCFSVGTFIGALLGMASTAVQFPVLWHLVLIGLAGAGLLVWAIRAVPPGTGRASSPERSPDVSSRGPAVWKDPRLLLIGVIAMAMALAEGTATDWLPLIMVDGHGFDSTSGSAVFVIFAASMAVGRFCGGPIVERFGYVRVLAASATFGLLGMAMVAFVDNPVITVVAVIAWGLGTSLGFPVALSAAGRSGARPAARVALVSTIGYLALLVGPPLLGFAGEHLGLRNALAVPILVLAVAVIFVRAARPRAEKAAALKP